MGRIRVDEIRFASYGVICENPYPVCKPMLSVCYNTICILSVCYIVICIHLSAITLSVFYLSAIILFVFLIILQTLADKSNHYNRLKGIKDTVFVLNIPTFHTGHII